jgi:hypothetical protein
VVQDARDGWRSVRRKRANPPAIAAEYEEQRQVFQSALAQAEELWEAASVAGPASRPLPLFSCLSQAGRAVCAAWTTEPEWRPQSPGLRRRVPDNPAPQARTLNYAASVDVGRNPAYSMVAEATASTTFTGEASVAQLWASLPGFPTSRDIFGDRPRCLTLEPVREYVDQEAMFTQLETPTHGVLRFSRVALSDLPTVYPAVQRIAQGGTRYSAFGTEDPVYTFPRQDGSLRPLHEVGIRPFYVEDTFGGLVIRPLVGTEPIGPPSEFLTLWALLFCLSGLARSYPDAWVGALDPDRSTAAVTLEHGLEVALERTPSLIAGALEGPVPTMIREEIRRGVVGASAAEPEPPESSGG